MWYFGNLWLFMITKPFDSQTADDNLAHFYSPLNCLNICLQNTPIIKETQWLAKQSQNMHQLILFLISGNCHVIRWAKSVTIMVKTHRIHHTDTSLLLRNDIQLKYPPSHQWRSGIIVTWSPIKSRELSIFTTQGSENQSQGFISPCATNTGNSTAGSAAVMGQSESCHQVRWCDQPIRAN